MSDADLQPLRFDEFELDERNARLTRQGEQLQLPPKAFAVLCTLARQPGQLITKGALLDSAWGHRHVSESVLKTTISQLRAALSDVAARPRYIETVPRRGYRFSGQVTPASAVPQWHAPVTSPATTGLQMIGRTGALQRLQSAWARAVGGQRQVVWIAGDAGVGKSTLIAAFAERSGAAAVARGQCVEQYGTGEPYLPVLEALGSLSRNYPELPAMLRAIAPTWLLQLPWLISDADRSALYRELSGVHQDRRVRELAELIERFTLQRPLLFITEDLHWSDTATLRLIDHFARGRGPSRVLWLSSVRMTQVIAEGHPLQQLRQELRLHRLCEELLLDPFSETEVADYLAQRLPQTVISEPFVRRVHQHTDGLPLFVVNVIESLLARGDADALRCEDRAGLPATTPWVIPDNVADAIEAHIARLPLELQTLLELASVAGMEFCAVLVGEVIGREAAWVSERCDELLRRQYWLRPAAMAVLEDGSLDARYMFRHALYRQVFYRRIEAAKRVQLHRRIAAALERGRSRTLSITAAELASHCELGMLIPAAVRHYTEAAHNALTHFAPDEAANIAAHALDLLQQCPPDAQRLELELTLVSHRGIACSQVHGIAASATRAAFERAHALCELLPQNPTRALMLNGLAWVYFVRGEYAQARAIAERLHALASEHDDRMLRICACSLFGVTLSLRGELHEARRWLEAGIADCDQLGERLTETPFVIDQAVLLRINLAVPLMHLGLLEQSVMHMEAAMQRAEKLGQPMGRMVTQWHMAMLQMRLQQPSRVAELADSLAQIVATAALGQGEGPSRWLRGWAEAYCGDPRVGYQRILEGFECHEKLGMYAGCAEVLGYAAEALLVAREWDAATKQAAAGLALAQRLGERIVEPYLLMLQARAALGAGAEDTARSLMREALSGAQAQQSTWNQLRVLTALCELRPVQPMDVRALRAICQRLQTGVDCKPYARAREVLAAYPDD